MNLSITEKFTITSSQERDLALMILRLPEYIDGVFFDLQINKICNMLYDISCRIGSFYKSNKVLGSPEEKSRILLLQATAVCMKKVFDLLGMKTLDHL
jgi:arginyl-tRNA synthetase